MDKPKLLATSPTLEGIVKMINKFWYSESYSLMPTSHPTVWNISRPDKLMTDYRVMLKSGRYRFEYIKSGANTQ